MGVESPAVGLISTYSSLGWYNMHVWVEKEQNWDLQCLAITDVNISLKKRQRFVFKTSSGEKPTAGQKQRDDCLWRRHANFLSEISQLWGACIHTMSHWSSRLPVQSPGGYLCETGILLLALSRYIGDPDVIDHCGLVWGGLHPELSLAVVPTMW
jgi:hypothetical protein